MASVIFFAGDYSYFECNLEYVVSAVVFNLFSVVFFRVIFFGYVILNSAETVSVCFYFLHVTFYKTIFILV